MKWPFFAGVGVGAALGILLAPKSGAELREDIQDTARTSYEGGKDRLQAILEEASKRMHPVVDEALNRLDPVVEAARERVKPIMDDAARGLSEAGDGLVEAAESGKESLMTIVNDWPHERLVEINGIGPVLASKIIQYRPYKSEEDLLESKQLPPSAIESLRDAA